MAILAMNGPNPPIDVPQKTQNNGSPVWKVRLWKWWYAINVPIIILLDSNAVIPEKFQVTKSLLDGYIDRFHDFLCASPPWWLQWMTVLELGFQLPVAIYSLWKLWTISNGRGDVRGALTSVKYWSRLYALNVIVTTTFCMWYVWQYGYYPDQIGHVLMGYPDKLALMSVYLPYVVVPIVLFL